MVALNMFFVNYLGCFLSQLSWVVFLIDRIRWAVRHIQIENEVGSTEVLEKNAFEFSL